MQALANAVLTDEERSSVLEATERAIANRRQEPFAPLTLIDMVVFVERAGLVERTNLALRELASEKWTAGIIAASALIPTLSAAEARALSASIAPWAVKDADLARIRRSIERLVAVAPDAWAEAAAQHLQEPQSIFGWGIPCVLEQLPLAARRRALAGVTSADLSPLPWVTEREFGWTVRRDDILARLRFDAGVEPIEYSDPAGRA
jgi:hypothetical protein